MNYMFCECSSLSSLPDISKWNTNNVKDMNSMFLRCSSLSFLPKISNWNSNMNGIFAQCENLISSKKVLKNINFYTMDNNEIESEGNSILFIF